MKEEKNLKELILGYAKHWVWFLLSVVITLTYAFVKLRYATPTYLVTSKIKILDNNSEGGLDLFKDLDILSNNKNNVLDEIELIKSRSNFIEVVKKLKLNISVYQEGDIKSSELYGNIPISLNFIAEDSIINKTEFSFYLFLNSDTNFDLSLEEDMPSKTYAFGKNIPSPIGDIVITPNVGLLDYYKGKQLRVVVTPVDLTASAYRNSVDVSSEDDKSSILELYLENAIPEKAAKVLNELIRVYNENGKQDKKAIADRTSNFIDARIADISANLESVDESAEKLRTSKGITDIAAETNINLQTGANNRQQLSTVENQLQIARGMKDIIEQQGEYEVLPTNIGLTDVTMSSTTSKYNQLVQQRNRLLKSSNERNPIIQNLNQQLESLKASMSSSLESNVTNLELTLNTLSKQNATINSRIYSAPKNERALRDITRQQQTTESLYLYLLQKSEEAQIAAASTSPNCKIVDEAHLASRFPVSPNRRKYLLAALMIGLFIPFGVIYVRDLLDNKVHSMRSLEPYVNAVPILGELPKLTKTQMKKIVADDRSVLSEALRLLRTNLDYLIKSRKSDKNRNNIIFVSSSVSGEGKTFVSSNLAMILASTNKKVLLIGADIRNPKIYNFFTGQNIDKMNTSSGKKNIGFTEYLTDEKIRVDDLVNSMLVDKNTIDIIYSGRIPPNPAELLMGARAKELFKTVSSMYDYVIVDTAPLMVVTDTQLIAPHADHLIYVTRAGVTESKAVQYPLKLQEEGKIKGLSFVVNDVSDSNLGYGGKYGYGYGRTIKKWWKIS